MFEGTDNDWQNLPKSKQIKMVADMLDRIKNDYPDENLAEKISLLAMNRMMFSEMPDLEYNRAVRQVFGSKADKIIKVTSKLNEMTDNITVRSPDGEILVGEDFE